MTPVTASLQTSAAARWRNTLSNRSTGRRNRWATRTAYYRALTQVLEGGTRYPSWSDIVESVQPRGSRTTFYELAGRRARHQLLRSYQERDERNLLLLSFMYQRDNAVEQFIDETKVWSYWPYRSDWLAGAEAGLENAPMPPLDGLLRTFVDWARRNPALAEAMGHEPPICVVEDLMILFRWELEPAVAVRILRQSLLCALGPRSDVVDSVRGAMENGGDVLTQRRWLEHDRVVVLLGAAAG